jgi:hypothetical protein
MNETPKALAGIKAGRLIGCRKSGIINVPHNFENPRDFRNLESSNGYAGLPKRGPKTRSDLYLIADVAAGVSSNDSRLSPRTAA